MHFRDEFPVLIFSKPMAVHLAEAGLPCAGILFLAAITSLFLLWMVWFMKTRHPALTVGRG
jgi:hypothetical protein